MKAVRVRALAERAGIDLDEALVTLWDAGLDALTGPNDLVPSRQMRTAVAALGIDEDPKVRNIDYWCELAGLTREELSAKLASTGIRLPPKARKIPKNSLRRFQKMFAVGGVRPSRQTSQRTNPPPVQAAPLEWREIGAVQVQTYLDAGDMCRIHAALADDFAASDPITPSGVRELGLLESAAARPQTSLGQILKYPTAEMAAAALFHSVALNHAFYNGNKRTALISASGSGWS